MLYTVKEISELAKVTVKTMHHYHRIGLLLPCCVSDAGYRLYGEKELERLQQILFYRELDFPLKEIKKLLDGEPERLSILACQKQLLFSRMQRLERLVQTIDESIRCTAEGVMMDKKAMFNGFGTEQEWKEALSEQTQYLKAKYNYDLIEENPIDVASMNQSAQDAMHFMVRMANALREGVRFDDQKVQNLIERHIHSLNKQGHVTTAASFAAQAKFFLHDEFHRNMLEAQQTGLSYYLYVAAEDLATKKV
ncbi:MerR family transcriptional regulator [Desulforamulus aeronauticus]|uniref:DNA-binding transcriptional regulator, MerR family n=1 Tax=Desulforamulus aeronauticus DSM 10349 TaxID=1121421 RepID=A0A1M6SR81_9FIRM|nr:MerR family transcriptional regulator [Desulforamulus aeronauticus]SHK47137.1 DNA-binding transcriptional regulator, MerR family [Desulforamulus aeronauticus DSM 10349]